MVADACSQLFVSPLKGVFSDKWEIIISELALNRKTKFRDIMAEKNFRQYLHLACDPRGLGKPQVITLILETN